MTKIRIGIDPGAETGFSVIRDGRLWVVETTDFWGATELIRIYNDQQRFIELNLVVYIEAPQLVPPTFNRGQGRKVNEKISQNVGENKAHSKLLIEYCERNNIEVVPVKPSGGPLTKMDDAFFRKLTGWTKRTSQHSRDAVSMIWGR